MVSRVGVNLNPEGLHKASLPGDTGSRFTSEHGEPLRLPSGTVCAKGVFVVVWGLGTTGLAPVGPKARLQPMSGAKPRFGFFGFLVFVLSFFSIPHDRFLRCRTLAPTTEFRFVVNCKGPQRNL